VVFSFVYNACDKSCGFSPAPQLDFDHRGVCGSSVTAGRLFSDRYNRLHLIPTRLHFRNWFTL